VADRAALAGLLEEDATLEELADDLVEQIRSGAIDDREDEVLAVLRGIVRRKLIITNPAYVLDSPGTTAS
jgi:hypothetical protein